MTVDPAAVRGAVRRPGEAAHRRGRVGAARPRARRHELPQLPARRRADLARGQPGRARHRLASGRGQGHRLRRPDDDAQRTRGRPVRSRRSSSRCWRCGWRRSVSIRSMPRPSAIATRRSCSSAGSRTTASRWARSRPASAARCSCRPRRPSSTRPGTAVMGSREPFLKKRTEGTERADKAAPNRGVEKFFGALPSWELYTEPSNVDVVIVPAIDGNFDPSSVEMIPFERQFQTFHSLQNYFLLNELLAPGFADADGRHGPASRGPGRLRPALRRTAVLLHPGGHAAGAPRRGGSGALGPGRCEPSRTSDRPTSTTPSPCSPSTGPMRVRWRVGRT